MTRNDPFIHQLEEYLEEFDGATPLPDAVRDSLREDVARTGQVGAARGFMSYLEGFSLPGPARYGLAAAAVVAAIAFGAAIGSPRASVGTSPIPTPSATPTAQPTPSDGLLEPGLIEPDEGGPLAAGMHSVDAPFPVQVTFEVPAGWDAWAYTSAASQINLNGSGPGEVSFEIIDNLAADPCTEKFLDPPVGPSVDDLVSALSNLEGFEATPATDVTVSGFPGKQLKLTAPESSCGLLTWKTTTRQNGVAPGEVNEIKIVDVDGVRLLICVAYTPPVSATARAEFESVIDSILLRP